jgi:DNA-binding NarL/FixJ family response regulator
MKLLIVEDNPALRSMLKDMFQSDFEEIIECEDGSDAFESYRIYNPDWVFMDIKMKTINGIEATRIIKNSYPGAKIIILTDYDDTKLRSDAKSSGVYAYILKENVFDIYRVLYTTKL